MCAVFFLSFFVYNPCPFKKKRRTHKAPNPSFFGCCCFIVGGNYIQTKALFLCFSLIQNPLTPFFKIGQKNRQKNRQKQNKLFYSKVYSFFLFQSCLLAVIKHFYSFFFIRKILPPFCFAFAFFFCFLFLLFF